MCLEKAPNLRYLSLCVCVEVYGCVPACSCMHVIVWMLRSGDKFQVLVLSCHPRDHLGRTQIVLSMNVYVPLLAELACQLKLSYQWF